MKIIINQPRISYYVGGAEIISFQHAKYLSGTDLYWKRLVNIGRAILKYHCQL